MDFGFLQTFNFWLILTLIAVFGYGLIRTMPFLRRIPIINNRRTFILLAVVGLILTSGWLTDFGLGSLSPAGAWAISDLQVTTTFLTDAGGTATENSNQDDLMDLRFTDAQANETTDVYELDTGVITVTRAGALPADSCTVTCMVPPKYQDESAPTGQVYSVLEESAIGESECYLMGASSATAATTSSPKETTSIPFAEGVAVGYLGVALEVDEEGHDALDQYSYKDVIVDFCGQEHYTFRIHRMDA